jgi:hypothetical protein
MTTRSTYGCAIAAAAKRSTDAVRDTPDERDRRDRMARLAAWLEELDALHGPPSAEDLAEAREWLRSATPVRPT